jgi:hypothetical protein
MAHGYTSVRRAVARRLARLPLAPARLDAPRSQPRAIDGPDHAAITSAFPYRAGVARHPPQGGETAEPLATDIDAGCHLAPRSPVAGLVQGWHIHGKPIAKARHGAHSMLRVTWSGYAGSPRVPRNISPLAPHPIGWPDRSTPPPGTSGRSWLEVQRGAARPMHSRSSTSFSEIPTASGCQK